MLFFSSPLRWPIFVCANWLLGWWSGGDSFLLFPECVFLLWRLLVRQRQRLRQLLLLTVVLPLCPPLLLLDDCSSFDTLLPYCTYNTGICTVAAIGSFFSLSQPIHLWWLRPLLLSALLAFLVLPFALDMASDVANSNFSSSVRFPAMVARAQ